MTKTNMDLSELLAKHDQGDFLRSVAEGRPAADHGGGCRRPDRALAKHERSGERTTWRNGYRERALDTRLGTLNLRVPKLRQGSYFPGFLEAAQEPRNRRWWPSSRRRGSVVCLDPSRR